MNEYEMITPGLGPDYNRLLQSVGDTLNKGRSAAAAAVNTAMVHTYWEIGRQIVEFEQKGSGKAEYGTEVLKRLSRDLTKRFGKGFSHSNIFYVRKLYLITKIGSVSLLFSRHRIFNDQ